MECYQVTFWYLLPTIFYIFLDFKEDILKDDAFVKFDNPDRPESIGIEVFDDDENVNEDPVIKDDLDTFVDVFREEHGISEEARPVRMPEEPPKPARIHPNHRYPVRPRQPFTVSPKGSPVGHSYMKNSYKHMTGKMVLIVVEGYRIIPQSS